VSQKLRAIHLKAAGELGYIPNRAAQQLRKASRESVAVITASTSNSYYLDLMAGIQHALKPANWTVVVADVAVDGVYESLLEDRIPYSWGYFDTDSEAGKHEALCQLGYSRRVRGFLSPCQCGELSERDNRQLQRQSARWATSRRTWIQGLDLPCVPDQMVYPV
jgi:hypothetical protein